MKIYKWEGRGHYLSSTVIVAADCLADAKEIIEKLLINNNLVKSWEETNEVVEICNGNNCEVIYFDNGDY